MKKKRYELREKKVENNVFLCIYDTKEDEIIEFYTLDCRETAQYDCDFANAYD